MEEEELDIDTGLPTKEEFKRAVQTLKNGKAPGIDQITAELLKADIESTCVGLKCLFDLIWQEEKVPVQWKQGLICKIPKRGNPQQCGNWRGVTLLPTASKVLGKILISRVQGGVDDRLRKEQAGFSAGRGTVEQIFILRNILEQVDEWNATMYFHFVDFEKAFDSVHRNSLRRIMRAIGIPDKLIGLVKALYDGFTCAVIDEGEITERFPVVTGVKQGCCLSGFLFLMVIDWVMRKTVDGQRTSIRWDFIRPLEDTDYADDLRLLTSRVDHMREKTARLEENAGRVGLKLNPQKCKWMKVNSGNNEWLRVRDSVVEEVDSFSYLGAQVTKDGGDTLDIKKRTALAYASFNRLNKIWRARGINRKTKATLFKTLVLSVLLYGCETWKMTKGEEKKLDIFHTKCLRRIFRIR